MNACLDRNLGRCGPTRNEIDRGKRRLSDGKWPSHGADNQWTSACVFRCQSIRLEIGDVGPIRGEKYTVS